MPTISKEAITLAMLQEFTDYQVHYDEEEYTVLINNVKYNIGDCHSKIDELVYFLNFCKERYGC